MKKNNIIYWVVTILFSGFMIFSSIHQIQNSPDAHAFMSHLGYPDYFSQFIGVMKVLGVIAILVPGFPRLKEWAYAGFTFDLIGAIFASLAAGFTIGQTGFIFVGLIFVFGSYIFYHRLKG